MAPTAGISKLKRMHASRARSEDILWKLRLDRCVSVLKDPANRATLMDTESRYVEAGLIEALQLTPVKTETPMKAIKNSTDGAEPRESDSEGEADDDKEFGRNLNKYCDLSFNTWSRALRRAEGSVFTKPNMKTMQKRGERRASLGAVQKLGEFLLDINPDDSIDKSRRTKRKVIEHMVKLYKAKGCRGKGVIMPIDYKKNAPYRIKKNWATKL